MTREHWQVLCGIAIAMGSAFVLVLGILLLVHLGQALNGHPGQPKEPSKYERCLAAGGSYSEDEYHDKFQCTIKGE